MTAPARQAGPAPGSSPAAGRAGVSADRIVEVALEIVDHGGVDALTMRALAAKLGVAVTAIYWHVGDKEALLDAIAERVAAEVGGTRVSGADPVARIVSLGRSLRRNLLERAHLVGIAHQRGRTDAVFQPARRVLVRELTAAGLHGEDAAFAVRAVLELVSGSVLTQIQVDRTPEAAKAPERVWDEVDVIDAPELLELLTQPIDHERVFTRSLETLVRGLIAPQSNSPTSGATP